MVKIIVNKQWKLETIVSFALQQPEKYLSCQFA
jgi:hypothetical protein